MRTIGSSTSAGLGLRRGLLPSLLAMDDGAVDFLELAPDNFYPASNGKTCRR